VDSIFAIHSITYDHQIDPSFNDESSGRYTCVYVKQITFIEKIKRRIALALRDIALRP
jgi:hypothetical protein